MHNFKIYFLFFIFYSIIGWIIETIYCSILDKKLENRGFLIGPYCPIYGAGAVLMTLLLNNITKYPILLFIMAIIICSIVEYMTSLVLEKIYHVRWWDYSKRKFNLNGRICMRTMIPFGILGMIMMYVSNPIIFSFLNNIKLETLNILFLTFYIVFITDFLITILILGSIKNDNKVLEKDSTEEMKYIVKNAILSRSFLHRRLLNAFPNVRFIEKVKNRVKKTHKKIKSNINKK